MKSNMYILVICVLYFFDISIQVLGLLSNWVALLSYTDSLRGGGGVGGYTCSCETVLKEGRWKLF